MKRSSSIIFLTLLLSICFFSCKKKNYKEAELLINNCTNYWWDSTAINTNQFVEFQKSGGTQKIFKINNQTQLDSLIPLSGGMLNNVDLNSDVVYVFGAWPRCSSCPVLKKSKVKINASDNQIEFNVKIKAPDGKGAVSMLLLGFLIIPKSDEGYSISGSLVRSKEGLTNTTGSTGKETTEYSI